jgi:hypothetical protein
MNTISYFQSIPNSDFSKQSEELIEVYKQSWSKHGWNPIVLNEEYSKRNELLHKLDLDNPDANFYKTINSSNWKYHRSCYCRLLAYCQYVRENGATLYSDYDVMNYGFTPNILNFAKENSYFCGERAVVYLGEKGAEQMESAMLQFFSEEFNGDESSADVYVMGRYTNIFTPVYNNLENNEKAKWAYYYVGHSFDNNQDETLLVHYDGGCYTRGADRKLSRLQVIQDHNRL